MGSEEPQSPQSLESPKPTEKETPESESTTEPDSPDGEDHTPETLPRGFAIPLTTKKSGRAGFGINIEGRVPKRYQKESEEDEEGDQKEEKSKSEGDYSVRNVLGEEGVVMFDALLAAGKKDIGLTKTWGFKSSIIKFIVHSKQFFTDGKVSYDVLSSFDDQLNSIGTLLLELLYAKKAHPKVAELSVKPALLSTYLQETWFKFHEIVKPFCDAKELEKACEAVKYFGGSGFITQFLNDPEFKIEKQIMARHARLLLKAVLVPQCKKKKCKAPRVVTRQDWPGSKYCAKHHHERLQTLFETPSFDAFVEEKNS